MAAFWPIKAGWKSAVLAWRRGHPLRELTNRVFAPILKNVVNDIKSINFVNGFKSCSLCSWNPDAIDFRKCLGRNKNKDIIIESVNGNEKYHVLN